MKRILFILGSVLSLWLTVDLHASMIGNFQQISPVQLEEIKKDPMLVSPTIYPADPNAKTKAIDIDKAWQGLHFLLTGDPLKGNGPLALAILGGPEIGDDVGYGPAHYLSADQVKIVSGALSKISKEDLRSRFNPAAMKKADVYPQIWDSDPGAFDYLLENFRKMVLYYQEAAQNGNAMLIYFN